MPKEFVPKRLGLHRQAAIALYRALLSQCRNVPTVDGNRNALQNIVRNRFRANRELRGARRVKIAFTAGYTAVDHLDSSVAGNVKSTKLIEDYLSKSSARLKRPPKKSTRLKPSRPPNVLEPPREHKFFNVFPRPVVEGKRKVPFLVDANHFPFVRYKKPQPENLSRIIRDLIQQREKRYDRRFALEDYFIPLAQYEDHWDALLEQEFGRLKHFDVSDGSWAKTMKQLHQEVVDLIQNRTDRAEALGLRMLAVVDAEKKLAIQEEEERRQAVRHKLLAKKTQKKQEPMTVDDEDAFTKLGM